MAVAVTWFVKIYYVYMVFCRDGTYYVGMTNDLDRRIAEHNLGIDPACYTFSRRPVILVYSSGSTDVWEAISGEKQLKGWSHRKKSAFVRRDWAAMKRFSRQKSDRSR